MSRFEIDKSTIEATTKCWNNLACLNGGNACVCEVERSVSDRFVFVKPHNRVECPYRIAFGLSSYVCGCPVRNEIYRKHEAPAAQKDPAGSDPPGDKSK